MQGFLADRSDEEARPVEFSLFSSLKSQINGMMKGIDKRTSGYKLRVEALLPAPDMIPAMIDRAWTQA